MISQIKKILKRINPFRFLAKTYLNKINYKEYKKPTFGTFNERPIEYRFVFEQISEFYPKKILDVGTGITALPSLMANCGCEVTAIDNIKDYWIFGMFNRHYHIIDDDITKTKLNEKFDMITCVSTLEHIEKYNQAVDNMFKLLKKGGYLILTFPYNENKYIENIYKSPKSNVKKILSYKTSVYSRSNLEYWLNNNNAKIIKQEYWQFFTGDYWTEGKIILPPQKTTAKDKHQISCILLHKK